MANIMLTKICNLNCPYCFANQYVNKEKDIISIKNFTKAMNFILKTEDSIGFIGGEPTTHPELGDLFEIALGDARVKNITLFTNGINLRPYLKQISNPVVGGLINLNSSSIMGKQRYNKLISDLDEIYKDEETFERFGLGINLYKPDIDYKYIIDACQRYKKTRLRISVCVPNSDQYRNYNSLKWFKTMKPTVFRLFRDLYSHGIVPRYDCNLMPVCVLNEQEKDWVKKAQALANSYDVDTNIGDEYAICNPVLDILPDLSVVRCFGMSHDLQINIEDFEDLEEVRNYIYNKIDIFKFNMASNPECADCRLAKLSKCTGGCLAYKSEKIKKAYELCQNLNKE